jgi:tRNA A-37 threonylcarbamoyl transferase component Bud32
VGLGDFEHVECVGRGSFSTVFLVRKRETGTLYAMKVIDKREVVARKQVDNVNAERRILARLRHPFIVTLHFAFQTRERLHFVLTYCSGGELFFHLGRVGRLKEELARVYAAEITLALAYLHSLGIVYRDLKPENVLVDGDGHVRLADFGLSKEEVNSGVAGASSFCGTAEYLAPEMLRRTGHGTGVDWWALGMVLFEMLTGMPPWYTKERDVLFERVCSAPLVFPAHVGADARRLIRGLLVRDAAKRVGVRLGAAEVVAQPFFRGVDWQRLYDRRVDVPYVPLPVSRGERLGGLDGSAREADLAAEVFGGEAEREGGPGAAAGERASSAPPTAVAGSGGGGISHVRTSRDGADDARFAGFAFDGGRLADQAGRRSQRAVRESLFFAPSGTPPAGAARGRKRARLWGRGAMPRLDVNPRASPVIRRLSTGGSPGGSPRGPGGAGGDAPARVGSPLNPGGPRALARMRRRRSGGAEGGGARAPTAAPWKPAAAAATDVVASAHALPEDPASAVAAET